MDVEAHRPGEALREREPVKSASRLPWMVAVALLSVAVVALGTMLALRH